MYTDRFFVSRFITKANVDIVLACDHLLGSLGETRFVAVNWWGCEKPGEGYDQAEQDNGSDGLSRAV